MITNSVIPVLRGGLLERDQNGDAFALDLVASRDRVNERHTTVGLQLLPQARIVAVWPISNLAREQAGVVGGAR